ncbi:MAG: hypothetical protein RLZZ81_96 [Pseudomonadota bacterium]|jgi:antitoxin component of MazEF toxin-antitoxin module
MENYNTKISELDKLLNDITDSNRHQEVLNSDNSEDKEAW